MLQVCHAAGVPAESSFPEDTVADHVGSTWRRRYYAQLSDDEDLLADEASAGNAAPGGTGWHLREGVRPPGARRVPLCRWQRGARQWGRGAGGVGTHR